MKGADFNKLEAAQAKRDGATLVKNSGRGERKGDARLAPFLVDYKFTEAKSFSLNVEDYKVFEGNAWHEELEPVVVAIFRSHRDKRIAMVDWELLKELAEKAWMYDELTN